jgi:methyltransferase (TIGR00027 family)
MANVSRTAAYVALYRALETMERRRPPLFRDPYARRLLPRHLRAALLLARVPGLQRWLERYADSRAPGARTSAIARTAYIDEVVRRVLGSGVGQVVILGAGYDCRAQRMPELARALVFEVDREPTQRRKRALLGATRSNYVAVDFLKDDTFSRLSEHGWDRTRVTLFVWEGVTNYLDEAAVLRVLGEVSRCAEGSSIVFTYVHRGVIDGSVTFEGAQQIVNNVRGLSEPWTFGIAPEDLPAFVARTGLRLREDLGADEYRARYLPAWENEHGYAFYRLALAERLRSDA